MTPMTMRLSGALRQALGFGYLSQNLPEFEKRAYLLIRLNDKSFAVAFVCIGDENRWPVLRQSRRNAPTPTRFTQAIGDNVPYFIETICLCSGVKEFLNNRRGSRNNQSLAFYFALFQLWAEI
jgi:hypothetical protein